MFLALGKQNNKLLFLFLKSSHSICRGKKKKTFVIERNIIKSHANRSKKQKQLSRLVGRTHREGGIYSGLQRMSRIFLGKLGEEGGHILMELHA